ncbi:MAG: FAD-dependent oxidoreductase [Bacillales bacterium]
MKNLSTKQCVPKSIPLSKSISNFNEVEETYSEEEAVLEASRCLNCKNSPCINGCPLQNNIPLMNFLISNKKFLEAYDVARNTNNLGMITGRVCNHQKQCELKCVRNIKNKSESVSISRLERFIFDYYNSNYPEKTININRNGNRIAIFGSGPSGLVCAEDLFLAGFQVDVYEKESYPGGILKYGIPNFVLPKNIINNYINKLKNLGVNFICNYDVELIKNINDFITTNNYKAIYIATGSSIHNKMNIENEDSENVFYADDFLKLINYNMENYIYNKRLDFFKEAKRIIVVGGGNVAIDVDRVLRRITNSEIINIYRRSEKEMPCREDEYNQALKEDILFKFLTNPKKILVKYNKLYALECVDMELKNIDSSSRPKPYEIEGSNYIIDTDIIIFAIGNYNKLLFADELNNDGFNYFINEETLQTSNPKIFVGGDLIKGEKTVARAIKNGKQAAYHICKSILINSGI